MTEFCFWEFWNLPSADRVHPVDSGDSERLVFGAGQAVAERSQSQPLVVPTAGPLDHVTHGLPVWRADGGGERERTLVQLFRHCSVREDALCNIITYQPLQTSVYQLEICFLCFSYQRSHPRLSLTENCCGFPRLVKNTSSGLHADAQWSSLRF